MDAIAAIILQIFVLLLFAKILGGIFEKFHMPKLIGEIIAGIVFINLVIFFPSFGHLLNFVVDENAPNGFNNPNYTNFFHIMGEIGIIFLLFAVGLDTKFSDMKKVGKAATYIAILGIIIPFVGGVMFIFHDLIDMHAALLIGAALFGSSTAVGVECLRNLDAMNTNEAKLIVSATIIDDILCLALLGIIIAATKDDVSTIEITANIAIVIIFVLVMFFFISRIKKIAALRRKRKQRSRGKEKHTDPKAVACATDEANEPMGELGSLGLAVIVCMGLAALSATIGLAAIIGAFLAGMIFAEFKDTIPCEQNFNVITYFMLPFFFVWVGMEVQFDQVFDYGSEIFVLLAAIVIVAIVTKYVAGFIGGKMGHLSNDSCSLIGISMVPRGEVGIIVATIGLSSGVFTHGIFTIIILMALITSMMVPPLMTHAYRNIEKNRAAAFEDTFEEIFRDELDEGEALPNEMPIQ